MSAHPWNLLLAPRRLLKRRRAARGPSAGAFVRRSIPTTYHALFRFLLESASASIMGTGAAVARRRALSRAFSHTGTKLAMDKVRGRSVSDSVAALFPSGGGAPVPVPDYIQEIAKAFIEAQGKRESADHDLGRKLGESDARQLRTRVRKAMEAWDAATTQADRDSKHSVCVLLLMKGQLRPGRG